jgi:CRISPR/Cas system CSM-associated protein Csm3 (group 7 of RAMP superfamily)
MDIKYKIEFFSNWHCGSGLAAGADVDALVVKDAKGLPYVPGRTLKGLFRESAQELVSDSTLISRIFGLSGDESPARAGDQRVGECFFGNAMLEEGATIVAAGLTPHLFQTFASTAIDEKSGIAKDNSLRKIETVVPCTLKGEIKNVPDGGEELLRKTMQMIKRMGTGRNRGYGRCKISFINE